MGIIIFITIVQGGVNETRYLRKALSTVPGIQKVFEKQKLLLMKHSSLGFGFFKKAVLERLLHPTVLC